MTYKITTAPQKTMFGQRTGCIVAKLESDWSSNVAVAAGPTATQAKTALLNQLGRLAGNPERAYVFCGDNLTILVVSFAGEAWQYDIIGADRTTRSGCIMPSISNFREATDRACEHAAQSYGGVLRIL